MPEVDPVSRTVFLTSEPRNKYCEQEQQTNHAIQHAAILHLLPFQHDIWNKCSYDQPDGGKAELLHGLVKIQPRKHNIAD